jgi:hypothetical protein
LERWFERDFVACRGIARYHVRSILGDEPALRYAGLFGSDSKTGKDVETDPSYSYGMISSAVAGRRQSLTGGEGFS